MDLIGRDKELALVSNGRNLVITGPEGAGKTALVRAALPDAVYCANSSTLKNACESLGFCAPDNVQRKRLLLRSTARCFVFDHLQHVTPKLLSLLEVLRESHRLVLVTRSLLWPLKTMLWGFDQLELRNLPERDARRLIEAEIKRLQLNVPPKFTREVWRLSRGNPRHILELCAQAGKQPYVSADLLDLDRRIGKLPARGQ
jgi:hypothetical protein